ncbi:MAG: threonine synthase [Oscillospiraceae bacterium]|nr:threonine synthase [Oscillospiraceae bacterium]
MQYISTRDKDVRVSAAQAIVQGISAEGGLFLPESIPQLTMTEIEQLWSMDYPARAGFISKKFLEEFTLTEISHSVNRAYGKQFSTEKIVPLVKIGANDYMLELFHGPTCAFKDMALQLLPQLLRLSMEKTNAKDMVILVATSGDTGKAALEGFRDVDGTQVLVFYPSEGVSPMQCLQMTTQEGGNVGVCAVKGNFDDAQTGVKAIFTSSDIKEKLAKKNLAFSSANSINWGRLLPQITYYFSAYAQLMSRQQVASGKKRKVNFVVPTGNFGNILAAYYAREMGLPIGKLICASNKNRVLTDFIRTGTYNARRDFYTTTSPSMDILISSNLERLLFLLCDGDCERLRGYMEALSQDGQYTVERDILEKLQDVFWAGSCDEIGSQTAIANMWEKNKYLCDPHTAVGAEVLRQYREETGDDAISIIAATASPYKFVTPVLNAIGASPQGDEFAQARQLEKLTGVPCPAQLLELAGKAIRFHECVEKDEMAQFVLGAI